MQLSRRKLNRGTGLVALRMAVASGLLAFLLFRTGIDSLAEAFESIDWIWIPIVVTIGVSTIVLRATRWRILLSEHDIHISLRRAVAKFWMSLFFNNILPGQIGGDASRVLHGWDSSVKKTNLATSVLMDRLVGLLAAFVMAVIGGFAAYKVLLDAGLAAIPWVALLGTTAISSVIFYRGPARVAERLARFIPSTSVRGATRATLNDLRIHVRSPWRFSWALGLSLAFNLLEGVGAYVTFLALGADVSFGGALAVAPVLALVMAIPITINGWGVKEATTVAIFALLGATETEALSVALIGRANLTLLGAVGGLIFLADSSKAGEAKEAPREAQTPAQAPSTGHYSPAD